MSEAAAYIPAGEVLRFGGALLLRVVIATIAGLVLMKVGQLIAHWSAEDAKLYGECAVGTFLIGSLYVKPIPWPQTAFKGIEETPPAESSAGE